MPSGRGPGRSVHLTGQPQRGGGEIPSADPAGREIDWVGAVIYQHSVESEQRRRKSSAVNPMFINPGVRYLHRQWPPCKIVVARPVPFSPGRRRHQCRRTASHRRNHPMLLKHVMPGLIVISCATAIGMGSCVAAEPLGQTAAQQRAPVRPPCVSTPGCSGTWAPGSMGDISKGLTDSLRTLAAGALIGGVLTGAINRTPTSGIPDPHTVAAGTPAK